MRRALLALAIALLAAASSAQPVLRVAVTGDYPPLSERAGDGDYVGFDADVARAFASERGYQLAFVPVRWSTLEGELRAERFDVAMTGVTVRPERAVAGRFSVPVLASGALALVTDPRLATREALAAAGVAIAVNAGGHLERVARVLFPAAALRPLPNNTAVLAALVAGEVPAVLTDSLEAPRWRAQEPSAIPVGPFTHDTKAYLLSAGRAPLADELDAWLLDREADGTLARLRARWLVGEAAERRSASPALALVAVLAERLTLMPLVAEAKRAAGLPVRDPEREARVRADAVAAALAAGARDHLSVPEQAALERFFDAVVDASCAVQEAVLAGPAGKPGFDLDAELRPAISRETDRIARLLPRLPLRLSVDALGAELASGPASDLPGFGRQERAALAGALDALAAAPRAPTF